MNRHALSRVPSVHIDSHTRALDRFPSHCLELRCRSGAPPRSPCYSPPSPPPPPSPPHDLPMALDLTELKTRDLSDLLALADQLKIDNAASLKKQDLIFEILRSQVGRGPGTANGTGVLETLPDGFGFLRAPDYNYLPGPDDIYVSPSQI